MRLPRSFAVLAIPLLLVACASDDAGTDAGAPSDAAATEPAAPAGGSATATAHDPCTLMSPEEVSAAAGLGSSTGQPSTSGGARVCTWTDAEGRSAIVQVHPSAARYEESRQAFESLYGGQAEALAGIADAAYVIGGDTGGMPTATVGARAGGATVNVQVMAMGGDRADLRSAALELTQRVVQKL